MGAYDAPLWNDFAVAVAGAAAALSGLLFVAVSINIERILSIPSLPPRAAQTLIMLVAPLVVAVVLLVPEQPRGALGTELIVGGLLLGVILGWLNRPSTQADEETRVTWLVARYLPSLLTASLLVIGGITLITEVGGGLYWVAPTVLIAFLAGLANAWVLLVEILR